MQSKKSFCMYCKKLCIISKHSSLKTCKCKECHKIWHKLRNRKNKFGKNTDVHKLVQWYINQPQICKECGSKEKITIDRMIPESKGGKYEIGNVQLLCYSCNCLKKINFNSVSDGIKSIKEKMCNNCGKILPLTSEYFHKNKYKAKYREVSKAMFNSICKTCRRKIVSFEKMKKRKPVKLNRIKYKDNYEYLYGKI